MKQLQSENGVSHSEPYLIHVLEVVGNAIMGGVEQYVYHVARYLPSLGCKVTVVTPFRSPYTTRLEEIGCPVYVTSMEDDPPWRSIQFISELVKEQRIDLIHAHLPKAQVLAGVSGSLAKIPVVTTIHGMDISSWELGILRLTNSHLNVVCEGAYAQALSLGIPSDKVTLIHNGVDIQMYKPLERNTRFRSMFQIPPDALLVGFVGRLSWEKGPEWFVQMAEYIHRSMPEVYFVMVGDGPMREEIEDMGSRLGLADRLVLPGVWNEMQDVYSAIDVLAQTSRVEGMPLTLLEAMAAGVPVTAMNPGGVVEVVEVGVSGYLSAIGDWMGQGNAVMSLLESPEKRRRFGEAARKRIEQQFDISYSMTRLAEEFRSFVKIPSLPAKLRQSREVAEKSSGASGTSVS